MCARDEFLKELDESGMRFASSEEYEKYLTEKDKQKRAKNEE